MWTPFVIFFLGYILSWMKSKFDKKKEIQIYKDLFIDWIRLSKDRTILQSNNCKDFSKELISSKYIDAERFHFSPLMFEKLNSINIDKVISPFVFNSTGIQSENLTNFNKLVANINYLDKIESELKERYSKSSSDLYKVNESFNKSFLEIERIFFRKLNEIGNEKGHKDGKHIKVLGDFRNNWERTAVNSGMGIDADHTFDKLVQPSLNYVKIAFNIDKSNNFLFEIYDELITMLIIKREWYAYKNGHSEIFKTYGKQIKSSYEDLEKCINFFEKNKIVFFWKIK